MSQPPNQPFQGEPYPGQSDPTQPHQGQQYPAAPSHPGQPDPQAPGGYPPPSYGAQPGQQGPGQPQGGYPPPGFAPPGAGAGFPGAFPPPEKKKSKALKIVLISLAVVLVLCIGGIAAAVLANKDDITGVIDAQNITVVEPATLGGRPKLTDPQFAEATTGLKEALSQAPGTTSTVGALYGDASKQDIVMIAGASAPLVNPEKQLEDTLKGASSGGLVLTDVVKVEPGPLGGTAKCGNSTTSGIKLGVCAWADNGSVGMIAVYFKSVDDVKAEFIDLRGQIEQKK
jgi:hypothetical protein